MKIGEKLFKWISYGFLVFLVGIIILTFGMPSFIGSAANSEKLLAAKVADEIITRKEVQNMKNYLLRLPQFQSFASQESFLTKYALDYLVSEKLQEVMQKQSGMYPLSDARHTIVARYLKENFKEYQTNDGFDFPRFEKEFLKPRRLGFAVIENEAVRDMVRVNRQLLEKFEMVSSYESSDMEELENTKVSYDILVFTPDEKKKILKSMTNISEKDIQEKFKKDYLAKDKNDKLTEMKREVITQALINEKKTETEKKWLSTLNQEIKTDTLPQLNKKYGGFFVHLHEVSLNTEFSSVEKNSKINFSLLENYEPFILSMTNGSNKIQGPWDIEDNLFIVSVGNLIQTGKNTPVKPVGNIEDEIKTANKNSASQVMDDIMKNETKVAKFNQLEE
ncbi:MAG: SurA N-terminal domain-containing protein [Spirochaetia bacterium]|nr:SurA N-terminal domain-containing protein [Spirochaetia bacterium]